MRDRVPPAGIALILLTLAGVACEDDQLLGPPSPLAFSVEYEWVMVDGWGPPPDGRCPTGHVFSGDLVGTGSFAELGASVITVSHCVDPARGTFVDGALSIEFPDGEVLSGTYSGQGVFTSPTEVAYQTDIVFDGGTGPYGDATGSALEIGSGTVVLDPGTGFIVGGEARSVIEGVISFGS